jgi:nitroreductase
LQKYLPDWSKAIDYRESVRKYSKTEPDKSLIENVRDIVQSYRPYPGARAVMVDEPLDVFTGFVGPIYKVTNPPYYVAFIVDKRIPHRFEAAGYMGEGIVLHATALGLNTCWVAGFFDPKKVSRQVDMEENEKVTAITPVGLAEDESELVEHAREFGVYRKRLIIDDLIMTGSTEPKPWQFAGIEGARLGPSALNHQPWRFKVEGDRVVLHVRKSFLTQGENAALGCGIAMLHFDLRASAAGANGRWKFLDDEGVAEYSLK